MSALAHPSSLPFALEFVTHISLRHITLDLSLAQPVQIRQREKSAIHTHPSRFSPALELHLPQQREPGAAVATVLGHPLPPRTFTLPHPPPPPAPQLPTPP